MGLTELWDKMFGYHSGFADPMPIIEPEKPKTDPIQALVHLVKMDMKMYPSDWRRKDEDCYHIYRNDKASLVIKINQLKAMRDRERCEINGIEVGEQYVADIERVFQQRDLQSLLEKLLDRVEKIEKVDVKQIQEAKRLELVDPFTVREDHMVTLQNALTAIEQAGTSSMKPKPIAISRPIVKPVTLSSSRPKLISTTQPKTVDTWRGTPVTKLTAEQFDEYMEYMDRRIASV